MPNWASKQRLGDSSTPDWQEQNLTWIEPAPGQRWQVYKPAATQFEGLLKDLIASGYKPTSSGGYNYRNIRGGSKLSQHAFGTAIDLNAQDNAMGQAGTDIPGAADLAKKWGLEWGGSWKNRPDPMHFEYAGGPNMVRPEPEAQYGLPAASVPPGEAPSAPSEPTYQPPPVPEQPAYTIDQPAPAQLSAPQATSMVDPKRQQAQKQQLAQILAMIGVPQ